MITTFYRQCRRDLLIYCRTPSLILNPIVFFLMIVVFFPLTLSSDLNMLREMTPSVVWTATLLATLLASERLFQPDYEQGLVAQWLTSDKSLTAIILARLSIHWITLIVPLLTLCPLLALLYHLSLKEMGVLMLSLLFATPILSTTAAFAAICVTDTQQKGMLMALVLLPLTLPVMIFGAATLYRLMHQLPISGLFALLAALSILSITLLPFTIAAVMRLTFIE